MHRPFADHAREITERDRVTEVAPRDMCDRQAMEEDNRRIAMNCSNVSGSTGKGTRSGRTSICQIRPAQPQSTTGMP